MNRSPGIGNVIIREIGRIRKNRLPLVLMIILPLFSLAIMTAIFYSGVPRELPVIVYDADNSPLSRLIKRSINATPSMTIVSTVENMEEGKRGILAGDGYALIVLPKELEKKVYQGRAPFVVCYNNNQFLMITGIIKTDITKVIQSISQGIYIRYRQQNFHETLQKAQAQSEPIKMDKHLLFNPYLNYMYFLLTALMPAIFQIFIIVLAVYVCGIELKEGTAKRWLDSAGSSSWKAIAGKLLPYTVIFFMIALLTGMLLFLVFRIPFEGNVLYILITTLVFIIAYQAMGLFLVSLTANMRFSISLAAFYSAPAFAFAGVTFPYFAMPFLGRTWANLLPLTHYLKILIDQSIRGIPPAFSINAFLCLALFPIAALLFSIPRMGYLLSHETYWGKL